MPDVFTLSVKDENFAGKVLNELLVKFKSKTITIRELIEARVRGEVEVYNTQRPAYYNGLVDPTDSEKTINGLKLHSRKQIDAEKQVYVALDAFQKNGFFVLVDDAQCTSLDQEIELHDDTHISFVKLTPLVGG